MPTKPTTRSLAATPKTVKHPRVRQAVDIRFEKLYYHLACLARREEMKRTWALQDAKNRFSEVVDRAIAEGPQTITRRGKETAVVVSMGEFKRLSAPRGSLVTFSSQISSRRSRS